jgi:hypothetical protein
MKFEVLSDPFPHIIGTDVWDQNELDLIWEELNYFTKPGKFITPEDYGAIPGKTNAMAIALDMIYPKGHTNMSNILGLKSTLLSKIKSSILEWSNIHYSLKPTVNANQSITKLRYYHDGEEYKSHVDCPYAYLIFMYFHKVPKQFSGGELFFDDFDYEFSCDNNSLILIPGYVRHGVSEVSIQKTQYYQGYGRYCVSMFLDYYRGE